MACRSFDIGGYTCAVYKHFNSLRSLHCSQFPDGSRFWDIIVLTASDEEQQKAYELQLSAKQQRGEIPTGILYHVFSDPPGPRIGCGGATMRAIVELEKIYGEEELSRKFVMLINAGGMSQRLPSASVLGKIFAPLPIIGCGESGAVSNWQLLELKMACYLPLLERMKPGYLHVPSDTIEVFDTGSPLLFDAGSTLEKEEIWSFTRPGMTALAHPSSIEIGRGHGVFVLEGSGSSDRLTQFQNCIKVLQKPTELEMSKSGAVLTSKVMSSTLLPHLSEYVYTDSLFYFDHTFAAALSSFYATEAPLQCELDGYGDFMRALGPRADPAFISCVSNPVARETKHRLFTHLQATNQDLHVITMDASRFYHLGTMREYIENLCVDQQLADWVGFKSLAFTAVVKQSGSTVDPSRSRSHLVITGETRSQFDPVGNGSQLDSDESRSDVGTKVKVSENRSKLLDDNSLGSSNSCVMHSCISDLVARGSASIVEHCRLIVDNDRDLTSISSSKDDVGNISVSAGLSIGSDCIISNCSVSLANEYVSIPDQIFLTTIPVRLSETSLTTSGYVTLVFHIDDDIKASGDVERIKYLNKPLDVTLARLPIGVLKIFSSQSGEKISGDNLSCNETTDKLSGSLWEAKIFPVMPTMGASFRLAVKLANGVELFSDRESVLDWYSAGQAMRHKDIEAMLLYRTELYQSISSELNNYKTTV